MYLQIILYLLSRVCLGMTGVFMIPLLMALYYGESIIPMGGSLLASLFMALLMLCLSQKANKDKISTREGIGAVFFSWLLAAILSSFPFVLDGVLDPVSAFFESMSGLTTTGATVIDDLEVLPKNILFWRSMTHWLGGIGIIVLFVALLPQIAGGAIHLYNAEVSGFSNSRILPKIHTTALTLFGIYFLLTFANFICLMVVGMGAYDAINHAMSAIATGGFSNYNASVAYFDNPLYELVLTFFMIVSGGNFALYYQMASKGWRVLVEDLEFKVYISVFVIFTLMISLNIWYMNGYSFLQSLRYSTFQMASFISTTGFVAVDYDQWPAFSKLLLAMTFFTGACAGSTAGGIKFCRLIVLVRTVGAELKRTMHPNMLLRVYYEKKVLPTDTIVNISRFFFVYIFIVVILSFLVSFTGIPLEESIFGVASCVSSVGPAFGSLGATQNFANVAPFAKIIFGIAMLLGRLEMFTALVLLRSEYWSKSKRW